MLRSVQASLSFRFFWLGMSRRTTFLFLDLLRCFWAGAGRSAMRFNSSISYLSSRISSVKQALASSQARERSRMLFLYLLISCSFCRFSPYNCWKARLSSSISHSSRPISSEVRITSSRMGAEAEAGAEAARSSRRMSLAFWYLSQLWRSCYRFSRRSRSALKRQTSVFAAVDRRCSCSSLAIALPSKWLALEGSASNLCVIYSARYSLPLFLKFCDGGLVTMGERSFEKDLIFYGESIKINAGGRGGGALFCRAVAGTWGRRRLHKTAGRVREYNHFLKPVILINKMAEKEMERLGRMRLDMEVRMLHSELDECHSQLRLKERVIEELRLRVARAEEGAIEERIAVEEETQCALAGEGGAEERELVGRLSAMLREREEQGVGLHLATLEKDREIAALTASLHRSQDLAAALHQELAIQRAAITDQEQLIDALKSENEQAREQAGGLGAALQEREAELTAQRESQQNLRILQENRVTLQHIMIQNQKQRQALAAQEGAAGEQSALMATLLEKEVGSLLEEKEKMKKIINNYDWKLFCLETELDLSNKEKKQYKFVNDKHEHRIAELEASTKQLTIKLFALEEEVKALEEENSFLETETDHKQRRIDDLLGQLEEAREAQAGEAVKELEYRLREKDEELREITGYLKEKMKEHHELKLRSAQLEKGLQEAQKKVEKAEFEAYEMEQCLIEHQDIMQKQTDRIDQTASEAEFLNGKINELSLMNMLRTQEFEEKLAALQAALREKSQKVNDLSVEIIEREIECNKKLEQATAQMGSSVLELEGKCRQLAENLQEAEGVVGRLAEKVRAAEGEVARLEELLSSKNGEISKIVSKMNGLELSVKEKEKLVQFLQAELKAAKGDFKEVRLANRRLEEELEELREVVAVSEEKLKILKKDAVESIETELNNEFEMEQLKRQLVKLEAERALLAEGRRQSEEALQRAREVVGELQASGKAKLHELAAHLTKPLASVDDTTTFEVLADEDFVPVEDTHEREREELLEIIERFQKQIDGICEQMQP